MRRLSFLTPDQLARLRTRIEAHSVRADDGTGCLLWTGKVIPSYGGPYPALTMRIPGRRTPANLIVTRLVLYIFKGIDCGEKQAAHVGPCCGVRTWCINPEHLEAQTPKQNATERSQRRAELLRIWREQVDKSLSCAHAPQSVT